MAQVLQLLKWELRGVAKYVVRARRAGTVVLREIRPATKDLVARAMDSWRT